MAAIKADHQEQKEKGRRSAWTKYVSLSIVFITVLAAVATQRGGGYSSAMLKQLNEATFNQANASYQWAFFQAKSIKQNLCEIERDRLLRTGAGADPKALEKLSTRIDKYDSEKKEITAIAKGFEEKRDAARAGATRAAEHSRGMGLAITLYQIAIALGGICLVVKKRWLWWFSLATGALAVLQMIQVLSVPL